jgi:hypothetical protein
MDCFLTVPLCSFTCCSCFCRLLEHLHLLDMLRSAVAAEDQAAQQQAEQQAQQDEQRQWYKVRQLLATSGALLSKGLMVWFLDSCSCLPQRPASCCKLQASLLTQPHFPLLLHAVFCSCLV